MLSESTKIISDSDNTEKMKWHIMLATAGMLKLRLRMGGLNVSDTLIEATMTLNNTLRLAANLFMEQDCCLKKKRSRLLRSYPIELKLDKSISNRLKVFPSTLKALRNKRYLKSKLTLKLMRLNRL